MRIAIVGAGVAGLTAARACARQGFDVTVFERAPELSDVGAGLQLGPNAVAVLDALGLGPGVRAIGVAPEAVEVRSPSRILVEVAAGPAAQARWHRPLLTVHRADLITLLATGLEAELRLGAEVEGTAAPDGRIAGERFDLVVAADGIGSTLRAHLGGTAPRFTGYAAWRALVPGPAPWGHRTVLTIGRDRHLVTYPLRGGTLTNLVAVQRRADWRREGWSHADDPRNLRAAFAGWSDAADALLARVDKTFLWALMDHPPLPRWHVGRLVGIGDAVHPMLPFLAQGAAMGLEDGWVLAACLADGRGVAGFEAARRPRATRMQAAARAQGRLNHVGLPWRPFVLAGMAAVGRALPEAGARRMDWIYGADVTA